VAKPDSRPPSIGSSMSSKNRNTPEGRHSDFRKLVFVPRSLEEHFTLVALHGGSIAWQMGLA